MEVSVGSGLSYNRCHGVVRGLDKELLPAGCGTLGSYYVYSWDSWADRGGRGVCRRHLEDTELRKKQEREGGMEEEGGRKEGGKKGGKNEEKEGRRKKGREEGREIPSGCTKKTG